MPKTVKVKARIVPQYDGELSSFYSNYFRFRQSENECLLEFGHVRPPSYEQEDDVPEELEIDAVMQGEIWLTREVAEQLHDLLGRQLAETEDIMDEETEQ